MDKSILIISEANDCRSQMAEAILKSLDDRMEVYSAGTDPKSRVNPFSIIAMDEMGIDIRKYYPKNINEFSNHTFDIIITLCENVNIDCQAIFLKIQSNYQYLIKDPSEQEVHEEEMLDQYRKVRDEIFSHLFGLYMDLRRN